MSETAPVGTELDRLVGDAFEDAPWGLVLLDATGFVLRYNRTEARLSGWRADDAIGLNFFHEVAPCTDVPEFRGRFRNGVARGALGERFLFDFNFVMDPVQVEVWLLDSSHPGRFWLTTRVVRTLQVARSEQATRLLDADRRGLDLREVDVEECEREQIHTPGAILAEGALIVLDLGVSELVAVSTNAGAYLDGDLRAGASADVLPPALLAAARRLAATSPAPDPTLPECVPLLDQRLPIQGLVHRWSDCIYCELIAIDGTHDAAASPLATAHGIARIAAAPSAHLLQETCDVIAELSGFDRVLAYSFDEDANGEVTAEACNGRMESLIGLRFPAEDIPSQARRLYVRNPVRYCSNAHYVPVPVAQRPGTPAVDLSFCQLRTFSPYHLQYQHNLGVHGFFSLSLRHRGKLTGLLIGHHSSPRHLGLDLRASLRAVAATAETSLGAGIAAAAQRRREDSERSYTAVLRDLATWRPGREPPASLATTTLMALFGADGAAVVHPAGVLSSLESAGEWAERVARTAQQERWRLPASTHRLREEHPELVPEGLDVSGLLLIGVPGANVWLLVWRRKRESVVEWARGPTAMPGAVRRWSEARSRVSEPWSGPEIELAERLSVELERAILPMWDASRLMQQILESDPAGILVSDVQGRVVECNRTAVEILNGETDLLGARVSDVIPGWKATAGTIEDGEAVPFRGARFPARISTARTRESGVSRYLVYLQDLRPIRLLEGRLREAQRLESVGTLAAGLAHDFNNCLAVVQANLDVLSQRLGPVESELIGDINGAARSGQQLAGQLLQFTQTARGEEGVRDLMALIRDSRRLLEVLTGSGVRVDWLLEGGPLPVSLSAAEVNQVLFNLLTNARDALGGRGRVEVHATRWATPEGDRAVLEVRDDGPGMDAATVEQVFDPFFTTKPRGVGTGLGLHQVRAVALSHAGTVEVESQPDRGTVFRFSVPLVLGQPVGRRRRETGSHPLDGVERALLEGLKVLFVDDRDDVRRAYAKMLAACGCEATARSSGEEALEEIEHGGRYEVVITDYSMEGLSGADLIRAAGHRPGLGFLLVSGLTPEEGFDDVTAPVMVLQKPIRLAGLRRSLVELVLRVRRA